MCEKIFMRGNAYKKKSTFTRSCKKPIDMVKNPCYYEGTIKRKGVNAYEERKHFLHTQGNVSY